MPTLSNAGTLIARILMSFLFAGAGITQVTDSSKVLTMIQDRSLPFPDLWYVASTAVLLAGALSLLLGWRTKWGAVALLVFILPATLLFHLHSDQADIELFSRDLAVAGGLFLLTQTGPGTLSLDARARSSVRNAPDDVAAAVLDGDQDAHARTV